MRRANLLIHLLPAVLFCGLFVYSCSSQNFFRVHYQLPVPTAELSGQTVLLSFQDVRSHKALVSQEAQKALKNYSGNFSLVVARGEDSEDLVGVFNLSSLFKELFKRRLQNSGINVAADAGQVDTQITIELEAFLLDLKDRKWIMQIAYRAHLKKNQKIQSTQSVSGSAERAKVIGNRDAEKVLGELLTDMINQLNLTKLFRQAGLLTKQ